LINHQTMIEHFLDTLNSGDMICSNHFVVWVRKNYSIPMHPRKAAELLDASIRTHKKRFTNTEKYQYWSETGRWVRVVWIIQEG